MEHGAQPRLPLALVVWAGKAAGGQFDHPSRIFLIDPRWRVREIYSLEYFKPAWALDDVRLLLKERTLATDEHR